LSRYPQSSPVDHATENPEASVEDAVLRRGNLAAEAEFAARSQIRTETVFDPNEAEWSQVYVKIFFLLIASVLWFIGEDEWADHSLSVYRSVAVVKNLNNKSFWLNAAFFFILSFFFSPLTISFISFIMVLGPFIYR